MRSIFDMWASEISHNLDLQEWESTQYLRKKNARPTNLVKGAVRDPKAQSIDADALGRSNKRSDAKTVY